MTEAIHTHHEKRRSQNQKEDTFSLCPAVSAAGIQRNHCDSDSQGSRDHKGKLPEPVPHKGCSTDGACEDMFSSQFDMARSIAGDDLPPVYTYAVETSIQLALTELNENLRELYIESYTHPDTAEYIYLQTTSELKNIFAPYLPDHSESDFYDMEIGTSGLMRSYMAKRCDIHFPLQRKLECFLTAAMRVYRVPEEDQEKVLAFIAVLDIEAVASEIVQKVFAMLEMKFDFKLSSEK